MNLWQTWFKSGWNYIDIIATAGPAALIVYFFQSGPGKEYEQFSSIINLFVGMKLLSYLKSMYLPFSTFVLMIKAIVVDLIPFLTVLIIILFMFMHSFYLLLSDKELDFHDDAPHPYDTSWAGIWTLYKTLLGDFDTDAYPDGFTSILFGIFSFGVMIVLLNVLIAIVSDTYDMVLVNSSELFWRSRLELIAEISTTFSWFLRGHGFRLYQRYCGRCHNSLYGIFVEGEQDTHTALGFIIGIHEDSKLSNKNSTPMLALRIMLAPVILALFAAYATLHFTTMPLRKFLVHMQRKMKGNNVDDVDIDFDLDLAMEDGRDGDWTGRVLDIVKRVNDKTGSEVGDVKRLLREHEEKYNRLAENVALISKQLKVPPKKESRKKHPLRYGAHSKNAMGLAGVVNRLKNFKKSASANSVATPAAGKGRAKAATAKFGGALADKNSTMLKLGVAVTTGAVIHPQNHPSSPRL